MTAGESGGLDGPVYGVDVIIRGGDEGDGDAAPEVVDPCGGHRGEVVLERSGDDPVVGSVGVEGTGITGSRGRLPLVGESVQSFELVDLAVGA